MKGLILSGGKGTRLRPITHTSAKQLIPVANKPILFFGIEAMKEAGISDIGIIVGDTREEVKAAVGDGSRWGVKITYIYQAQPLGLAHAVLTAEEFIGRDKFLMYLGDNLILGGVRAIAHDFLDKGCHSQILLAKVPNPQQFGVAELQGDKVVRLVEKPKQPKSDLALVGVYLFDQNIFKAAKSIKPSWRNELEITDAIQWLIENDYHVRYRLVDGWWKDTGKLEDLLEANRIILDQFETKIEGQVDAQSKIDFKVRIEEGAVVRNSQIRGPAVIGRGTQIIDSYIGPFTSIYTNCRVEKSEIEHSIVFEDSAIVGVPRRISDSLIGRGVQIQFVEKKPKTFQFMLGDASDVRIV